LLTGGTNPYFQSERFHLAKMTIALKAAATLFWPGELKFAVTKKSGDGKDHRAANLGMIRWQIGVAIASVCAGLWAAGAFWTGAWHRVPIWRGVRGAVRGDATAAGAVPVSAARAVVVWVGCGCAER